MRIKITGGQTSAVRYAGAAIDCPSDPEWKEIKNYGTDSEVGDYLLNHDGNCDYEEIRAPTETEAYQVSEKGDLFRNRQGREERPYKQFRDQMHKAKPQMVSVKTKTSFGKPTDRKNRKNGKPV